MAWIKTVTPEAASGFLKAIYDAAIRRAGRVYGILRIMSLRPKQLDASMALYLSAMHDAESELSLREREMVATVVSRLNHCHY